MAMAVAVSRAAPLAALHAPFASGVGTAPAAPRGSPGRAFLGPRARSRSLPSSAGDAAVGRRCRRGEATFSWELLILGRGPSGGDPPPRFLVVQKRRPSLSLKLAGR